MSSSESQAASDPCGVVRQACLKAGFKPGTGPTGLERACLKPIAYGTNPPKGATMVLPSVDSKAVDACRASLEGKSAVKPPATPSNTETAPAEQSHSPTAVAPHNPPPTQPGPGASPSR
jgi:hypothetical protein